MCRIIVGRENKLTPGEIIQRVTDVGGLTRFNDPQYRVVWGWSRLTLVGGKWEDRDENESVTRVRVEVRTIPKYVPTDRWHIERWLPPETYGSKDEWYHDTAELCGLRIIASLGPYPRRGEWEHCMTLATPGGQYVPLTPTVCEYVIQAVEWARRKSAAVSYEALLEREGRRQDKVCKEMEAVM
jgi:hypothetical protein